MTDWYDFVKSGLQSGATVTLDLGRPLVGSYGDLHAEYHALADGVALVDRTYRGLLEVTGTDRAVWLHNLTTNDVKTLSPGEGCYTFALNVQGRILFDLNVCMREGSIWIDLDRRHLSLGRTHLEKYIIMEDVNIADRSDDFVRLALVGGGAGAFLADLGAAHAATMPRLGTTEMKWRDRLIPVIRDDFCGPFAVELLVPAEAAVEFWCSLTEASQSARAVPAGHDAVEVHRIEAGIPWPFHEITDEYLPAETGQFERAASFTKGCYLGQEVVERMRSRGKVARQLVGLALDTDAVPPAGAKLTTDQNEPVGRVTSACRSIARDGVIGLGYVKTASSGAGTSLRAEWEDHSARAVVTDLPFTPGSDGAPVPTR